MSARKLGRFAGLVFVLAVVFGGVEAASVGHAHTVPAASVASSASATSSAGATSFVPMTTNLTIEWD